MRSLPFAVVLVVVGVAAPATAQVPNLFYRNDNIQNTTQFTFATKTFVGAAPNVLQFVYPSQATPDYIYGYVQTAPCMFMNGNPFGSAAYSNMFWRNANVKMAYYGNCNNHTFRKLPPQAQPINGQIMFCAMYGVQGYTIKDVTFAARPFARVQGTTANLTATLTNTRVGVGAPPQFSVAGFYLTPNGIVNVNQITPINGVTYDTGVAVSPQTVTMPQVNLTVPTATMPQKPANPTSMVFKVLYRLQL